MVTHRKALLALMDIVYVLDHGTLTDVNQLGGLDAYLAKLEGIEEQKVIAEVKEDETKEKQQDLGTMLKQYNELYGSVNNDTNPVIADTSNVVGMPVEVSLSHDTNHDFMSVQPQEVVKPWTPTVETDPIQMPDDSSLEIVEPNYSKDSDVTINLH